jgi:hypothetical protein
MDKQQTTPSQLNYRKIKTKFNIQKTCADEVLNEIK